MRRFSEMAEGDLASSILASPAPTPSQIARARETESRIEASLLALPDLDRELVVLKSFCNMSHAEITAALGISSENTARQAYFRSMEKLKKLLG